MTLKKDLQYFEKFHDALDKFRNGSQCFEKINNV